MNEVIAHRSVSQLAKRYFESKGLPARDVLSFYFCDNKKDADECAKLVLMGEKRATASSLWPYEENNEKIPQVNDISVVTAWDGIAQCIIEVVKVEIVPFNKITAKFAYEEGEGDKSLEFWKKVHWDYYYRELANSPYSPTTDMPIVCEYFRVVYQ